MRLSIATLFFLCIVAIFASRSYSEASKSCKEYLSICTESCKNRGDLFRFYCLGPGFNPDSERYRCQCGDDLSFIEKSIHVQESGK